MSTLNRRSTRAHTEWFLPALVMGISMFGIYCISIAMYNPETDNGLSLLGHILASRSGQMQCIWFMIAPVVLFFLYATPTEMFKALCFPIYFFILGLLAVTLVLSTAVNGINSWLKTGIGRSIQPCEFAKISVLLILAKYLSQKDVPMSTMKEFLTIVCIVGFPTGIVLLQGETGSVIVIGAMFMIMTYFAKVKLSVWISIAVAVGALIAIVVGYALITDTGDYRILRLLAFTDPTKYSESGGYQLLQSQKAIGAGMLNGTAAYRSDSMATLGFVPESSTDFIFSVVGETFGFYGCMGLLLAYFVMIVRMAFLAKNTMDKFGRLIIYGVMGMLFFHIFENVAMNIGLMPITGIPLPFMSYGGSSFLTNMIGIGLVIGVVRNRSMTDQDTEANDGQYVLSPTLAGNLREQSILRKLMFRKKD